MKNNNLRENKSLKSISSHKHNNKEYNHNHGHNCTHIHTDGTSKGITSAFCMNFIFTILEIIGGLLTNSTAILSDAVHDLGDTISLGVAWKLDKISHLPENDKLTYGYYRYSVIGSILNILVLSVGTLAILTSSISRLFNPQNVNAKGMFILAIMGVIMNGIAVLKVKSGTKISEKVVTLHLLEDVLGWIAVLIVSTVLLFIDLPILDPLLSLCISLYMIKNIVLNTKIIFNILLQSVPYGISIEDIKKSTFLTSKEIKDVQNIKCWSLDGETNVITLDISIDNIGNFKQVKNKIEKKLSSDYNAKHVTVSIV